MTTRLNVASESIRLQAGPLMQLGDVSQRTVPKMTLIAEPRHGGAISSRTFIPHRCHASIGVFGAVSVASACLLPGSVAQGLAQVAPGDTPLLSVEHPTGEFSVTLQLDADGALGWLRPVTHSATAVCWRGFYSGPRLAA